MGNISNNIRQQVKRRANGLCEYCKISDSATHFSHQIDHIIPPRHGGVDDIQNLAWACFYCNNNKGTDIATYDLLTRQPVFLFNPYHNDWFNYFEIENGRVLSFVPSGRATIRLLKMNDYKRIIIRRSLYE